MNYQELLEKYHALAAENDSLRKENTRLKAKLCDICHSRDSVNIKIHPAEIEDQIEVKFPAPIATLEIKPQEKIKLFRALFAGRNDVYAKRWRNKKGEKGYVPVCRNEWKSSLCRKPQVKCADCVHRLYDELTDQVIEEHLRGNAVIGVYPLLTDETCRFLAIDFDKEGWQRDVSAFRSVCLSFNIPVALERSRSGNGSHAWFFFENPIAASLARKFGSALITQAMSMNHQISFKSYDRLFPNQDTLPKGGLGNLIALPLQKKARDSGNSVFVDENFQAYNNQWEYLFSIARISEENVMSLSARLSGRDELGDLRRDDEEVEKPWEPKRQIRLAPQDFPKTMTFVRANMIFIPKAGISQRGLNALKRLAAFKNPEFYKAQAMRLSTYKKSRIISCCDETNDFLCLPRGCETDIKALLADAGIQADVLDQTQRGKSIDVDFKGTLRDDQREAVEVLLKHDTGVLSATTAFGKTVIAAKMITELKINTLILVHRQQLLEQWNDRFKVFLNINESLPVLEKKRGRKKIQNIIGLIGAGKNVPSGIVDIAIMQSLNRSGDVKALVKNTVWSLWMNAITCPLSVLKKSSSPFRHNMFMV
ncbi:MAG TPA: DEAD/DEAH box helicase family protein [Smithellaceae bacterium]|nr:DEAD/DEAH box helicase family protein [Smithellaceae bacterium]